MTGHTSYTAPRERRELERYIYVLAFSSGSVKVGQTRNPQRRIKNHADAAHVHGHIVARSWVSLPHVEYESNEEALITFCAERWTASSGRESFASADFDAIVEHAQGLPFTALPESQLEDFLGRLDQASAEGHARYEHRQVMAKLNEFREKVDLIIPLVNDGNRWAASDALYELAREAVALTPAAWADVDPTAAERYLCARGTSPELARRNAAEFELNFRTLYAIEFLREAGSFEDIARFCDAVTAGPQQLGIDGGAA